MNKPGLLFLILLILFVSNGLHGAAPGGSGPGLLKQNVQDTIKTRQALYNGILWKNMYHRIKNDQFLFTDFFLTGNLTINGQTFENKRLRYDIFSDELTIPLNRDDIVQLNKEMVDSFTLNFDSKLYRFINIKDEALKSLKGYVNVLYKGKSALYVKYKKDISQNVTETSDGEFFETTRIYLVLNGICYPVNRTSDLFKFTKDDKEQIRDFIKKTKLKVSKKKPESFIPVLRFYDSINQ